MIIHFIHFKCDYLTHYFKFCESMTFINYKFLFVYNYKDIALQANFFSLLDRLRTDTGKEHCFQNNYILPVTKVTVF